MTNAAALSPSPGAPVTDGGLPPRPYPGLRPFKTSEWRIFCGREGVINDVLYKLGDNNVVLVHGGSGCGKSSLIFAGVLPSLEREMRLGGRRLVSATIRPSQGPLTALAATLASLLGPAPEDTHEGRTTASRGGEGSAAWRTAAASWTTALLFAPDIVERIEAAIASNKIDLLCLILDQFEEIFRWAREQRASDVEAVCRLLAALARPGAGQRLVIIATMRSDFLGQCALFPALGDVINSCQYFLRGLEDRMLERAIRDPAALFGGTVDDALIRRLKTEATGALDALPVLQHALMRMAAPKLKAGATGWKLDLDDYRAVTTEPPGGSCPPTFVSNALSVHAEEVRATLVAADPDAAAAVDAVFRGLFDCDAGGQLIRRPTAPDKLQALAGPASGAVNKVIKAFSPDGTDLLFEILNPQGETIRVDVVHEALLRNWWRMRFGEKGQGPGWIEAQTGEALVWRTLALMAGDGDAVLDHRLLTRFADAIARFDAAPARAERYLLRSENRDKITAEPEWLAVKELLARSRRRIRIRRWLIVGVAFALLMVLLGVGWQISVNRRMIAVQQANRREEMATRQAQDRQRAELIADVVRNGTDAPEKALTTYQADVVQQLTVETNTPSPSGQYIWIGDGRTSNLKEENEAARPVAVGQIVKGRRYRVAVNVALRAELPDTKNSSPRTGALLAGTPLIALAPAIRAANGQYWLLVAPIQIATVFIQYGTGDPSVARQQLINAGFKVPPAQQLDTAKGMGEVRYCNRSDAPSAQSAATALAEQRGAPLTTRFIGNNPACAGVVAGIIEAWIDEPGARFSR